MARAVKKQFTDDDVIDSAAKASDIGVKTVSRSGEKIIGPDRTMAKGQSGERITLCSKLTMSLELQHQRKRVTQQKQRMGGAEVTFLDEVWEKEGPIYVLNGTSVPRGQMPEGYEPPPMAGGVSMTHNIPLDFWEKWCEQNKDFPALKNGLIFAVKLADHDEAKARAKELKGTECSFRPLSKLQIDAAGNEVGKHDPRMPRKTAMNVQRFTGEPKNSDDE